MDKGATGKKEDAADERDCQRPHCETQGEHQPGRKGTIALSISEHASPAWVSQLQWGQD
jgi:hypothetical protein